MLIDAATAEAHLAAADPVIGRLIASHGPFGMRIDAEDPFLSLSRAIVFQQLSGKAAGTIFRRYLGLFGDIGIVAPDSVPRTDPAWTPMAERSPAPDLVLATTDEELRGVGLSRQKVAALRDLALHFAEGNLSANLFEHWSDEEIITHLTRVRGIGRWSAEMYLMFHLGRPDVLPVNDVGINRAIQKLYNLDGPLKPPEVQRVGEPWRPWATVACWYLWRSEDVPLPTGE
jgi:3-methyladenine DNA glycosylase/8-oxoguanine DNA glycosylase